MVVSYIAEERTIEEALSLLSTMLAEPEYEKVRVFASDENVIAMSHVVELYQGSGITDEEIAEIAVESASSESIVIVAEGLYEFQNLDLLPKGWEPNEVGIPEGEIIVDLASNSNAKTVAAICQKTRELLAQGFAFEEIVDLLDVQDSRIIEELPSQIEALKDAGLDEKEVIEFALNAPSYSEFKYRISEMGKLEELDILAEYSSEHRVILGELEDEIEDWVACQDEKPECVGALEVGIQQDLMFR